jgi:2,3-dihydroxybiphenyl 1,2-dioxygenase
MNETGVSATWLRSRRWGRDDGGVRMDLLGIAYFGLDVPDPVAWAEFATSVVGLMAAPRPPGPCAEDVRFLKADERQWRVALHRADRPGIRYLGFDLGSLEAFDAALAHLDAAGAACSRGTEGERAARGVRDLVVVHDPSGTRIELCWGPTVDGGFVSPVGVPRFVSGELGFGHAVILTPDLEASMDFYRRVLGMKLSDYVVVGPDMSVQFLRCTPRHHSVALAALGPMRGVHHIAFEVGDIDQVGYALERATRAGHPVTATLGRHKNDRMLSFYMRSPAGFEVEIGCEGRLVDDRTWVANEFSGGDEWGHHGLTAEALAQSVGAQ